MTTHPTLEQRAKEVAVEIFEAVNANFHKSREPVDYIAEIIQRHLTSFATEAANAASEAMRDECLKLICRYQSLHPEWVQELIGKVAYVEPDPTWLQRHDAAVAAKAQLFQFLLEHCHTHQASNDVTDDRCVRCGHDIRHKIHLRVDDTRLDVLKLSEVERLTALTESADGK